MAPLPPQCPVYDLDNNVAFIGMYQTMTKKAAITVQVGTSPLPALAWRWRVVPDSRACRGYRSGAAPSPTASPGCVGRCGRHPGWALLTSVSPHSLGRPPQKKDFPSNSFYVVVVVKTEDEACGGALPYYPLSKNASPGMLGWGGCRRKPWVAGWGAASTEG